MHASDVQMTSLRVWRRQWARSHLRKWLRFYLDYCTKYRLDSSAELSFPPRQPHSKGLEKMTLAR